MTPIQQLMLGVGASKKTYLDDVFSTYLYDGNSTTLSVNSGVDNTKGGMIWFKARSESERHLLFDTERGTSNYIESNSTAAQTSGGAALTSFDNDGYTLGASAYQNNSGRTYTSWNFRKAKGFFDIVTWTGNNTARTIAHSLGSVPGCILIKCKDAGFNWMVYHRGANGGVNPADYGLRLNATNAQTDNSTYFNDTLPTSTHFTIGTNSQVNADGSNYVAYVFAGGESNAATAKSVEFNGSSQSLHMAASTSSMDFVSSGKFTIEFFVKLDSLTNGSTSANYQTMVGRWQGSTGYSWLIDTNKGDGDINLYLGDGTTNYYASIDAPNGTISAGQWYHIAVVKNGTTGTIFVDGIPKVSSSSWTQGSTNNSTIVQVANNNSSFGSALDGQISNFRVTNGQALYTAAFKPPTEPLTTTSQGATASNVKILMCQDTNPTVGAVTTGTITNNGSATASSDSPFDDPEGFKFGEEGDQNIIKCGSYKGSGSAGLEVNLGWEPSWLMLKVTSRTGDWYIMDSMRGVVTSGNDEYLKANGSDAEGSADVIEFTSTGFKVISTGTHWNNSAETYSFTAIRRSDGYVGKPAEAGTNAFAMDVGSNNFPAFDSTFPVDFVLQKAPSAAANWLVPSRLTGSAKYLKTNLNTAEASWDVFDFDSNVGWGKESTWASATNNAWMWKRGQGFDVVCYTGDLVAGRQIPHSLNKIPEMLWVKRRNDPSDWIVWHKGLNGGTNSGQYYVALNSSNAESSASYYWNNTTQNSTTFFTLGGNASVNGENDTFIAMLFASVDGISKVGYYTGTGSATTITTGFQPRFLLIKKVSSAVGWYLLDTTRGWGSGDDKYLTLDSNAAQLNADFGAPTSTGFTLASGSGGYNGSGGKYIYYAHA